MPLTFCVQLTEVEAKALLGAVNRAWGSTPPGRDRRASDRAARRIETVLRQYQAAQIPERGVA